MAALSSGQTDLAANAERQFSCESRRAANLTGNASRRNFLNLMANGTFSYGINTPPSYTANPPIDYPRLLVSDTVQFAADGVTPVYVFSDQEITAMESIVAMQFQSAQFFSFGGNPPAGGALGTFTFPNPPANYLRTAAYLLKSLASNASRLSAVTQLLDVKLAPGIAAKALNTQADSYLELDDNSAAFVIIEQVSNAWSFRDRFYKQWQRQSFLAGG